MPFQTAGSARDRRCHIVPSRRRAARLVTTCWRYRAAVPRWQCIPVQRTTTKSAIELDTNSNRRCDWRRQRVVYDANMTGCDVFSCDKDGGYDDITPRWLIDLKQWLQPSYSHSNRRARLSNFHSLCHFLIRLTFTTPPFSNSDSNK